LKLLRFTDAIHWWPPGLLVHFLMPSLGDRASTLTLTLSLCLVL
jgi:hypothetical protein